MRTEIFWVQAGTLAVTPGTPTLAGSYPIRMNQLASAYLTGLQATWEEFLIRCVEFEVISVGGTNPAGSSGWPGLVKFYLDEDDGTAPTATSSLSHMGPVLNRTAKGTRDRIHVRWEARDTEDLNWKNIQSDTNVIVGYLKYYSDATNWASGAGGGVDFIVVPRFCIQVRNQGGV